ncbi:MAG: HAD family hydrolase [Mariprofundaceae bacterium]|nr:HAD family hydrolase [Mariprofundaceae bacterium]
MNSEPRHAVALGCRSFSEEIHKRGIHNIQGVLLDMDGTLVDAFTPIVRAMNQTLKEFGLKELTALDIRRHTGKGDCSMIALFGQHKVDASQRFIEIHDEDYFTGIFPLTGAAALLNDLQKKNIPTAIVTSKGQERAEAQLKHLGWFNKIHTIIGKLEGRASKPDPEPLILACKDLGVEAEHCIMIGDGTADMKAAKRAASYGIGLTASFSAHELHEAGAILTFPTLIEVHSWLRAQIR